MTIVWPVMVSVRHIVTTMSPAQSSLLAGFSRTTLPRRSRSAHGARVRLSSILLWVEGLLAGRLIMLTSTFLINHFELFGLHQVTNNLAGHPMPVPRFHTPLYYKFVRHPIYLGFMIAFWAAATMTVGHLLFAAVTAAYIFVGILLEERDLVDLFGDDYLRYKDRVSMMVPWRKSA
jgi:hypothetical protein